MPPANRLECRHCHSDQYMTRRGLEQHEGKCPALRQPSLKTKSVAATILNIGSTILKKKFSIRIRQKSPPPTIATEQQSETTLWDQVRYTPLNFHATNLIRNLGQQNDTFMEDQVRCLSCNFMLQF